MKCYMMSILSHTDSTESVIVQDKEDHLTNILPQVPSGDTWVAYDKSLWPNSYQVVHHDPASYVLMMCFVSEKDTRTKTTQMSLKSKLSGESQSKLILINRL